MISETLETFGGLHKVINQEFRNKVFDSDFALVLASFTGYNYKDRMVVVLLLNLLLFVIC